MNLCRCEKGHFYDKEKYSSCPHCAGGGASDDTLTAAFTEDGNPGGGMGAGMQIPPTLATDITEQVNPNQGGGLPVADMPADQFTVAANGPGDTPTLPIIPIDEVITEKPDEEDDHTVGFFDDAFFTSPGVANVGKTESVVKKIVQNKVSTPCVGWLIAIGGEHVGTDFRLKVGKNFIGRDTKMDVALTEEKSVSRDRHAIVVYEPKTHMYLVQPGESSSLVYRNNEVVLTPVKLEAYDVITVGDINLLFMPLCGARFNWSDLFEEMKKGK